MRKRLREVFGLRGNIPALAISEVVSDTGWNMYEVVWQPYVLSLGASMPALGTLTATQTALSSALQVITGRISDSLGRKPLLMLSCLLTIASVASIILARSWIFLLPAIILLSISNSLWEPVSAPLIAESVEEDQRGTAFSLITFTWFLPGFYAPMLAGYLANAYGFRHVFGLMLITEIFSSVIFAVYVAETLKVKKELKIRDLFKSMRGVFSPKFGLSKFYAAMIIDRFCIFIGQGIFFGMLFKTFGFNMIQLGILSNTFSIAVAVSQIPMGKLVDRYGRRGFLITSKAIWAIVFVGYLFSTDFVGFLTCQILLALGVSAWLPAFNAYVSNAVPETERGRVFGDINCLRGLLSFPAPIIGAFLYEGYGFKAPILLSLFLSIAVIFILFAIEER